MAHTITFPSHLPKFRKYIKKELSRSETIVKIPTNIDPTGIGIDQFVMREQ